MARFDVILFDIDDVLLKTSTVKWAQHKFVAKKYYNIELTNETLAKHWGKPFHQMVGLLYGQADTPQNMMDNFVRHELEFRKELFPDTVHTLNELHKTGVTMGLITSGRWAVSKIEVELLKIPLDYFAIVQGSDDSEFHKPDPRVFSPALATLAKKGFTNKANMVYIGDALSDFFAARDAGLQFIAVTTGMTAPAAFRAAGATNIAPRLRDILPLAT